MSRVLICVLAFLVSLSAQSNNSNNDDRFPFAFSAGPIIKINGMGDGVLATLGGRINGSYGYFVFGLGGFGVVGQSNLKLSTMAENVSYSYGGLGLGVRLFPRSFIHITNYNTFGLGKLDLKNRSEGGLAYSIEPEINLEVDIFSLCRIGTGISYRWLFSDKVTPPAKELRGLGWQFFVEFGSI